jgi:hypothetical protein
MGVSKQVLQDDYMLHIALLDVSVCTEIEDKYIKPYFKIDKSEKLATIDDHRSIGLDVRPPDVMRYFVRVKDDVLDTFIADNKFSSMDRRDAEDEFLYQNSFKINTHYYASRGWPTSAIRHADVSGIRAAVIRLARSMKRWCIMATLPIIRL